MIAINRLVAYVGLGAAKTAVSLTAITLMVRSGVPPWLAVTIVYVLCFLAVWRIECRIFLERGGERPVYVVIAWSIAWLCGTAAATMAAHLLAGGSQLGWVTSFATALASSAGAMAGSLGWWWLIVRYRHAPT